MHLQRTIRGDEWRKGGDYYQKRQDKGGHYAKWLLPHEAAEVAHQAPLGTQLGPPLGTLSAPRSANSGAIRGARNAPPHNRRSRTVSEEETELNSLRRFLRERIVDAEHRRCGAPNHW